MATEVKVASIPDCDVCKAEGRKPKPAAYDGKTVYGPWAYMCEDDWQKVGVGKLGTGFGQRLILES
jgi:hypothetical protein